jgi:hypothetical protein
VVGQPGQDQEISALRNRERQALRLSFYLRPPALPAGLYKIRLSPMTGLRKQLFIS